MAKIAISYRRADTEAIAGRIRDHLVGHYGDQNVFMDINNIPFGVDFRKHIQVELADSQVLFAIVGNSWLGPTEDGHFRIADEADFVRIEVETAAQNDTTIIPVLINNSTMPKPEQLSNSVKFLRF